MKRISTPLVVFLCLQFSIIGEAQEVLKSNMHAVDAYFKRLESFGLSGSLLIGNKNEILLQKDYGDTKHDIKYPPAYIIASLMKQFSATAILFLEQEGALKTSDKISMHLPNIPKDKSAITIHQLLTHTSGLGDAYWDAKENRDLSLNDFVTKILGKPLEYSPGEIFSYSNFGYDIIARIIEEKTNKTRANFLVENIFQPNGIQFIGDGSITWKNKQIVQYNDWAVSGTDLNLGPNSLDWPWANFYATTTDLYKWYHLIFNTNKILTDESKKKLLTIEKDNYAYGWNIGKTERGTKLIYHGGYDSWLGVVTGFYFYAEEDLLIIFLGNTNMNKTLRHEYLMQEVESILFGGYTKYPPYAASLNTSAQTCYGEYGTGERKINISEGKMPGQVKCRTRDAAIIKHLLFPNAHQYHNLRDEQLEFVVDHINRDDYEPLRKEFFKGKFDQFKLRYSRTWQQLVGGFGKYKAMKIIHQKPLIFKGNIELQIFCELFFEKGSFYIRATRLQNGRIAFHPFYLPSRFEAYFISDAPNSFISWNFKYGAISKLQFKNKQLIINDKEELAFMKRSKN